MINRRNFVLTKYALSLLIFGELLRMKHIRPGPVRVANFDVSPLPFRAREFR